MPLPWTRRVWRRSIGTVHRREPHVPIPAIRDHMTIGHLVEPRRDVGRATVRVLHAPASEGTAPRAVRQRTGWAVAALLLTGTLGGCTMVGPPPMPASPRPIELSIPPESPNDRLFAADGLAGWELLPPDFTPSGGWDAILHSPTASNPAFLERIDYWTGIWRRSEVNRVPLYLERMALYQDLVDGVLEEHGLPKSLRYLPFLESGYSPRAVSRASAAGLWQFMAPTAADMRLSVTAYIDERRDPVKSTAAAAVYLTQLHQRFGSWYLALAAYNGGLGRVERLIAQHAPDAARDDDLYLTLGPHLPQETREFVARFIAGARVASDPEAFGFITPVGVEPFAWDEVVVADAASLDMLARAAGTTEAVIAALNPQLLRGMTLPRASTTVRVPPGSAVEFPVRWAAIPPEERVSVTEHRVSAGETLTQIARAYGIRLDELQAANPGLDPRRLRIGQGLVVPVNPPARGGL